MGRRARIKSDRRAGRRVLDGRAPTRDAAEIGVDPTALDAVVDADRAYFEAHPETDRYVRASIPGELPTACACCTATHVLVVQVRPGSRFRAGFRSADGVPSPEVLAQVERALKIARLAGA